MTEKALALVTAFVIAFMITRENKKKDLLDSLRSSRGQALNCFSFIMKEGYLLISSGLKYQEFL
jgi:hypothetical protein